MQLFQGYRSIRFSVQGDVFTKSRLGFAFAFLVIAFLVGNIYSQHSVVIWASVLVAYMAMNIGANDIANNMGLIVGSRTLPLVTAIIVAVVFEFAGAVLAGNRVSETVTHSIINPHLMQSKDGFQVYIYVLISALLGAALWVNLATYAKAPVSTTHSIIGGILGAGMAAIGSLIISWKLLWSMTLSWLISPIMGGVLASFFLAIVYKTIVGKPDKVSASKRWIPIFSAMMVWVFISYVFLLLLTEALYDSMLLALVPALMVFVVTKVWLSRRKLQDNTDRDDSAVWFSVPLIFSAALMSFAHGANDVANAIGPLVAISNTIELPSSSVIPSWMFVLGASGIVLGAFLYGQRMIRFVGNEITELDQSRAFSIAMAVALVVIIASQLGLPVSSTHIAIGGVVGVGYFREWWPASLEIDRAQLNQIKAKVTEQKRILSQLRSELNVLSDLAVKTAMDEQRIEVLYNHIVEEKRELKQVKGVLKGMRSNLYVKTETVKKIILGWLLTVPTSAVAAAIIFNTLQLVMN